MPPKDGSVQARRRRQLPMAAPPRPRTRRGRVADRLHSPLRPFSFPGSSCSSTPLAHVQRNRSGTPSRQLSRRDPRVVVKLRLIAAPTVSRSHQGERRLARVGDIGAGGQGWAPWALSREGFPSSHAPLPRRSRRPRRPPPLPPCSRHTQSSRPACPPVENRVWIRVVPLPRPRHAHPLPARVVLLTLALTRSRLPHPLLLSRHALARARGGCNGAELLPVVHDTCARPSRGSCATERGLLAALLEMSVRDAAMGPGMLRSRVRADRRRMGQAVPRPPRGLCRALAHSGGEIRRRRRSLARG